MLRDNHAHCAAGTRNYATILSGIGDAGRIGQGMSVIRSRVGVRGMTLIELLCVMGIIAMLAALLLPALAQAQARARRLQCINDLHQVGVGFVNFANEHNGQFPMAVPMSAGGTLELAQSGYRLEGDFYFSFRHFQAASNELVTPNVVVCPADTRPPAASFTTLSNASLSYFVGVNAEFARPTSILAGDRNLTNDYATPGTLVRLGGNYPLHWTDELHRFKGNLLFSDGHVEEKNSPALVVTANQTPVIANLAMPTVRPPGFSSSAEEADAKTRSGGIAFTRPGGGVRGQRASIMPAGGVPEEAPSPPRVERRSTNGVAANPPAKSAEEDASSPWLGPWLTAITGVLAGRSLWWFYALLLLLAVAALALRRAARGRKQRAAKSPKLSPTSIK